MTPSVVTPKPFKIECVIVCDKYHDFLGKTLSQNKHQFDRVVVVTSPEDKETRKICEYHHVECIPTDSLRSRWGEFCKGCGINEGLDKLQKDAWVLHMDADILLPPQSRILLQRADLDPSMIYGIDRFIVKGYKAWAEFVDKPVLQHECDTYIHLNAFPLGTRVMSDGFVPIGFFQLWNPKVSGKLTYPQQHTTAGRGDFMFGKSWPRSKRGFLPEIVGYHIESDDSRMEANWAGRTTAPFEFGVGDEV